MQRLAGQVAIVTGGAQGIGGATARRLAEEGARVLIVDVDQATMDTNLERIAQAGGTAAGLIADVSTPDGIQAMVDHAVERWGALHIVVNNAYGAFERNEAVATSDETWDRTMDLGLKAMFRSARLAIPHMRQAGGGSIVNMSSVHGMLAAPSWFLYEVVKPAVIGLTRQLAVQYGSFGIRVNAICPGHIVTEKLAQLWQNNPAGLRFFEQQYPLRRTGRPVDIANAIVFLCSDEASFITGQALVVDGGLSIQLQEDLSIRLAQYAIEHPDSV
jgi:NAD(P)-dependent dehydrogenase (short-subunit alcohol dehydrogenase family)